MLLVFNSVQFSARIFLNDQRYCWEKGDTVSQTVRFEGSLLLYGGACLARRQICDTKKRMEKVNELR